MSYARRFGAFLSDFLVGDAPELFVGPIVLLAAGWWLLQIGLDPAGVGLILFLGVLAVVAVHLTVAIRASS